MFFTTIKSRDVGVRLSLKDIVSFFGAEGFDA